MSIDLYQLNNKSFPEGFPLFRVQSIFSYCNCSLATPILQSKTHPSTYLQGCTPANTVQRSSLLRCLDSTIARTCSRLPPLPSPLLPAVSGPCERSGTVRFLEVQIQSQRSPSPTTAIEIGPHVRRCPALRPQGFNVPWRFQLKTVCDFITEQLMILLTYGHLWPRQTCQRKNPNYAASQTGKNTIKP